MNSRRKFLAAGAAAGAAVMFESGRALAQGTPVKSVTAVTQVFGNGQRLTDVAIEYGQPIDGTKLSTASFTVADRHVIDVFTSATADPADRAASGPFVIVALSADDPAAVLKLARKAPDGGNGPGGPRGPGGPGPGPGGLGGPGASASLAAPPGPPRPGMMDGPLTPGGGDHAPRYKIATASVTQIGPVTTTSVTTTSGAAIAATGAALPTTRIKNLIADDFRQFTFHDPATGMALAYNLYIPKDYDKSKSYPLVMFMHDASVIGGDTVDTLRQGLGAVSWASPRDQAKHPSFVLAPEYPIWMVNDYSQYSNMLDTTVDLIHALLGQYNIDRKRLYNTGQSAGAMTSIAMDIKYPDLFAASFIVAGQWDAEKTRPLARKKLWIVVSQGDPKAYPGENAITAVLEQQGARISRAVWDGTSTPEEFERDVQAMEAKHTPINYVALRKGTVVPPGLSMAAGGGDHQNTWRIAYTIDGIRDWIFRQSL